MFIKIFPLTLLTSLYLYALELEVTVPKVKTSGDDFITWIAIFGLALIAFFALYLSSTRAESIKKEFEEREEEEKKEIESQDKILSKMGESIYDMAKDKSAKHSETQLLAVTTNLIEFLRIKSKKVVVTHEKLKISNLLNDVSGTLKANIKYKQLELIYDIDPSVSKVITSDTLNLSKILTNILIYCVDKDSRYVTLTIDSNSLTSKNDQLFFTINSHLQIDVEKEGDIFDSKYNEKTDTYESLGLFIAKELSLLIHGDLIARNNKNRELEFVFNIPYIYEEETKTEVKESSKKLNILVIDSSQNTAEYIASVLKNLGHKTTIISAKEYLFDLPIFYKFDVIFLEENLFVDDVVMQLQRVESQIVATYNIFQKAQEFDNSKIADLKVSKPLTHWQIENILTQLERDKKERESNRQTTAINSGNALVHRNSFQMTRNVTLGKFVQFQGKKILLVEDNLINQKVFLGMLGKSKMQIKVANNGQEALDILAEDKNFDIIFMDINMPVMDGYTASVKIRQNSDYDDIPIVALSALTSNDEIAKMFTSGMNAYIAKPLKKEILFTVFLIFIENTKIPHAKEIESDENKIQNLDGLNIELGISKTAYNDIFYKEILIEFRDAYQGSDVMFKKLVDDFRYEQLRILCLDIKGLSGTIGAEDLHLIITQIIKTIILKKYDAVPTLVEKYTQELQKVNASIEKYLST